MIQKLLSFAAILAMHTMAYAQSPFIHKVYDFSPAPGQFTNDLPEYEENDTHNDLIRKAQEAIAGEEKTMISLGAYGGYIIFGFDHKVQNINGKYDFKIWGNAFYSNSNPNPDASNEGGSCEPGIVSVSVDSNGNGIPDDTWYELAGSEYFKSSTTHKYQITYLRPDPNKTPQPNENYPFLNDTTYIKWIDNQNNTGYIPRNTFHAQPYFPLWQNSDSLTFKGTLLANNSIDESGDGSYYVQYAYRWGYADNHPNNDDRSSFDISWAVDSLGNPIILDGIHFVRVHTAVNQHCGWLGDTSTEIMGAEDLHLQNIDIDVPPYTEGIRISRSQDTLQTNQTLQLTARIFSSNPTLENTIWRSLHPDIASVTNNGTVEAHHPGNTWITATAEGSLFSDSCAITVNDQTSQSPQVRRPQSKAKYSNQTLQLIELQAHQCSLYNANGIALQNFVPSTKHDLRHIPLTPGLYLLKAQKQNHIQTFKIVVLR